MGPDSVNGQAPGGGGGAGGSGAGAGAGAGGGFGGPGGEGGEGEGPFGMVPDMDPGWLFSQLAWTQKTSASGLGDDAASASWRGRTFLRPHPLAFAVQAWQPMALCRAQAAQHSVGLLR